MIEVKNLSKVYDSDALTVIALRDVSFEIKKGLQYKLKPSLLYSAETLIDQLAIIF